MKPETKELLKSLLSSARGSDAAKHAEVAQKLEDPKVLETLDSEEDYANAGSFKLRVAQVVEALARNPAPSAQGAFVALTQSDAFTANDDRTIALVSSSKFIRPAPPELVQFWDKYSQPDDGFTPVTITVLVDNGSPPAIDLFRRKLVEPTHDDDNKLAWMRTRVLPHRNDVHLLEACVPLLEVELPEHLKTPLVEVLFDFRPEEWFRPTTDASPPPLESASPESLEQIIRVAIISLTMVPLTDELRSTVKERLEQAEHLRDASRARP